MSKGCEDKHSRRDEYEGSLCKKSWAGVLSAHKSRDVTTYQRNPSTLGLVGITSERCHQGDFDHLSHLDVSWPVPETSAMGAV